MNQGGGIFTFMETPKSQAEPSISELKARLFENERVEEYLRAEVKELWIHIRNFERDPFLRIYLKVKRGFKKILIRFFHLIKNFVVKPTHDRPEQLSSINVFYDILLVLPSDKIEIGGLVSATKFVEELSLEGYSVKNVSLTHDPTASKSTNVEVVSSVEEVGKAKLVLACGAETVKFVEKYSLKNNSKSILLMQGPDPYFTPKVTDSINFLDSISRFNLVISYSPYLEKLARFWGAENVTTAVFGPDEKVFVFNNVLPRRKQIVVPCRYGTEKGIRILLPTLSKLRQQGWTVIGFGDLPDLAMAVYFDDFVGRISPAETSQLFQESQISIDPSLIEGLGLTTLEAAKCGCVPIIQKRGGFEGMFGTNKLPFIEIENFLNPQVVIDAVNKSQIDLNPQLVNQRVSEISWSRGLEIAKKEIRNLLTK